MVTCRQGLYAWSSGGRSFTGKKALQNWNLAEQGEVLESIDPLP
jgi:hypothetical protein